MQQRSGLGMQVQNSCSLGCCEAGGGNTPDLTMVRGQIDQLEEHRTNTSAGNRPGG